MITKTADELHSLVKRVLLAAGADEGNAEETAQHLVLSNLSGVDTHGIWHIPIYVAAIQANELLPASKPAILQETANSALVTGNWTFGHVTAKYAMELAISKARTQNAAVVGIVQMYHIGRLGTYVEMAAADRMIGMVWGGGYGQVEPVSVPYGGKTRVLHTNPISIGLPAGEESTMMFDWATTALSGVKVENAYRRREQLPPNSIVDKDGIPTTNPDDYFAGGGHMPFGAHKGYTLMMTAEFLGRIFTGADSYVEAGRGGSVFPRQGVTMMAIKADLFQPFVDYAERADEMERRVRAVPPAPGFEEVLAPGDMEARTREQRRREGIPIADDVWQSFTEAAASVGLKVS